VLEHLLEIEYESEVLDAPADGFTPIKKIDTAELLEGQIQTTDWLKELGASTDEEVLEHAQEEIARDAFKALVANPTEAKAALQKVTLPPAIQKIVGMLTAYDWAFVEQAKELRGMAVAKIVEETDHPDARIRLKALELLGKVTEVGLFTERISVKKEDMSDDELDQKIRDKLAQLQKTVDAEATEIENRNADAQDVEDTSEEEDEPTQ
jgi:uncharacterized protein YjgD (DUF1641 family)